MSVGQRLAQSAFLCVVFSSSMGMACASPGDQDLIRERQNRLLEEQQRRLEDLRNLPGQPSVPPVPSRPEDERCFTIRSIDLKGADSLSITERDALLKPFVGQSQTRASWTIDVMDKSINGGRKVEIKFK